MEKIRIQRSDLVGVQAVYRSGELIYIDQQPEVKREDNRVYKTGKEGVDSDQRYES